MGRFLLGFFGIAFLLGGGAIMLLMGKPMLDQAHASKTWPTVEGTVTESRVETIKPQDRNDGPTYQAVVSFDYEVQKTSYNSSRIWFGGEISTNDQAEMQNIASQYVEGQKTTVYYDPQNPAEAVLQPGAFFSTYLLMIFGAVFAVPGIIMLLVACFVMKSRSESPAWNSDQHSVDLFADEDDEIDSDDKFDPDDEFDRDDEFGPDHEFGPDDHNQQFGDDSARSD